MKMGDGGFRPAYNVQYGTDTENQVIVAGAVVSSGSDQGQMAPMVEQVAEHCGHTPEECQARNRGLLRMSVRGLTKVKGGAVLFALAHNLMRMAALAPELIGLGTGRSAVPKTGA